MLSDKKFKFNISGGVLGNQFIKYPERSNNTEDYLKKKEEYLNKLMNAEYSRMNEEARRFNEAEVEPGDQKNPIGLALSGGGIRSATFSLGILQGLAQGKWIEKIDYLSTVSGGGYIGGSLSWFLGQKIEEIKKNQEPSIDKVNDYQKEETESSTNAVNDKHKDVIETSAEPVDDVKKEIPKYSTKAENFPFETEFGLNRKQVGTDNPYVANLRWLRQHGNYLTPGHGLNMSALIGVVARTIFPSILVYLGLLIGIFIVFGWIENVLAGIFNAPEWLMSILINLKVENYPVLVLAVGLTALLLMFVLFYIIITGLPAFLKKDIDLTKYQVRRVIEIANGWLVIGIIAALLLGSLPIVNNYVAAYIQKSIGAASIAGGILIGLRVVQRIVPIVIKAKAFIPTNVLVSIGVALICYGLLLLASSISHSKELWLYITVIVIIIIGFFTDINLISFHRYYRDRLMETFMPNADFNSRENGIANESETAWMKCYGGRRPYHIINTNLVLVRAKKTIFRGRGGDNFILSREYCGSSATGWASTEEFMNGTLSLPTAIAVSGAAANPNTGVGGEGLTRSRLISFLMAFLNIRLGMWVKNPGIWEKENQKWKKHALTPPNLIRPGLNSLFRMFGFREKSSWIELTDGGHFENLGIYELIRRRCKLIIACDAGSDPDFKFSDLGNAVERVRADFGVLINLEGEALRKLVPTKTDKSTPDELPAEAPLPFLIASIMYPTDGKRADMEGSDKGIFIYIKTTFHKTISSADVYSYKTTHKTFPDQTTGDQFFDEKQFEAYREAGFKTANELCREMKRVLDDEKNRKWFKDLTEYDLAKEAGKILGLQSST